MSDLEHVLLGAALFVGLAFLVIAWAWQSAIP